MNSLARISMLCGALILLVFGIVCLKQQFEPAPSAPPFIRPESMDFPVSQHEPMGQPTIHSSATHSSATHSSATHSSATHSSATTSAQESLDALRPQELTPIPEAGTAPQPIRLPDLSNAGYPREMPERGDFATAGQQDHASTPAVTSAVLLAPTESEPIPLNDPPSNVTPIATSQPQTVMTLPDDSLWKISERVYGRGDYFKALYLHNRALLPRPDRIAPGIELATPGSDVLWQLFPDNCPPPRELAASPQGS